VLRGLAPERLLDSYDAERIAAADENLLNTTRSTDFIAPKGAASRMFRDGVLALAETEPFARRLVNSGRLSTATCYEGSPLNGPDRFAAGECPASRPGAAALDAPVDGGWLLHRLGGSFTGAWFGPSGQIPENVAGAQVAPAQSAVPLNQIAVACDAACARYGAQQQPAYYLFRPDGHVVARWRHRGGGAVKAALDRALALS
jgi:3-(3-hydroxy-phenyl)propionate hydroxylase